MSDYVIVGAGINGLLTARELAAQGASVTLVERGEVGRESSWAGGGIVSPLYPWRYPEPISALAAWAQNAYPRLAQQLQEETGIDVEYQADGLLMLDADDEREALRWARVQAQAMRSADPAWVFAAEPGLGPNFSRALWMPRVAHVRNPRLCRALVESLRRTGRVRIIEHRPLVSLQLQGDRISGLRVSGTEGEAATLPSRELILCAGAWTAQILSGLRPEPLAVAPVKGQMLLFKLPDRPLSRIVLRQGRYLIPRRDGHLLAGSTLEFAGFDKATTVSARQSLLDSARALLPQLKEVEPVRQWAGLRPGSGDGLPFIGRLQPWQNLWLNAGQYRNGLVLAPASARLLVDLLLNRLPIVDPAPYRPDREACWKIRESA